MAKKNKLNLKGAPVSVELYNDFIKVAGIIFSKKEPAFRLVKKEFFSRESEVILKEIANLFKTHKFPIGRIYLNVPRHLIMARSARLPSTNDDEIKSMVEMESARQMPYRDEDIIVGYRIIEKLKDGYSDVLMAIAQASTINLFIKTLKGANLMVKKMVLSSESLFGWYLAMKEKTKGESKNNIALINVDSTYIDVDIIEKGKLAFTRAFTYSKVEMPFNKDTLDEIKQSIETYQKEKKSTVEKVIITGARNIVKAIEPVLREELGIPLEVIDQSKNITLDKNVEASLGDTSFAGLVGLCLKDKEMEINLLPVNMIEDNELAVLKKNLSKTLILLSCVALIFFTIIAKKIFDKSRYLGLLNSKIKTMEPKVKKAKRMREDIRIIKNVVQKKPLAIDVVAEIYKVTPGGVTFNLIDYESDRSLALRGTAPSLDAVIKFITILEKSQYFENVKVKYTAKRSISGSQVTEFEIICQLSRV
ncbi:MAG: pilus assembly protein PilM [Candidatus Omnitrophica bacterium]|nr:pilus assembly protein PilM [Candidatus Omnitrophota bacterium]